MKLVVGLGNPEDKYKNTRHNFGYMAIDRWNKIKNIPCAGLIFYDDPEANILISSIRIGEEEVVALKPSQGMNVSGKQVKKVIDLFELQPSDLVVLYDEMDLQLEQIKVKPVGNMIRHNGVKSIAEEVGKDFTLIKLGIGLPEDKSKKLEWVLGDFDTTELNKVNDVLNKSTEIIECFITNGLDKTMNKYNQ